VERLSIASGGGTAQVTGSIRLEELTAARLNLGIRSTDFRAIDVPELVTATVSGDVQLRGPLSGATLTGRGTVTRGVVWFADIVEKDIINLEDTAYAGLVDRALLLEEGLGAGFENRFLDSLNITGLQLTMGSDVWLRSNEANIALTGDVTLAKAGQNYRLDGTLNAPRGTYRLQLIPLVEGFEREFTVTRGQVQYFGTADLDAALDIEARHMVRTRRGDNVTIFVHVGGTIYSPTLTLSSDHRPALSDTEIISYLLVGAPNVGGGGSGLLGQQGVGVAEAIAGRLSGRMIGGLITDLGVPIDYFEFRPQFEGGLSGTVSVGRRITDRVFVTVNPRICGRDQWELHNLGFGLEYRLSGAWRLAMAADPLGSCSLLGADPSTLRYQLGLDLWWETTY
jgi:autotransporter translocation and assembly factor TamB